MKRDSDQDLRERFTALRDEERGLAPAFATRVREREVSVHRRVWPWPAAAMAMLLVAVAVGVGIGIQRPSDSLENPDVWQANSQWTMPTDVLLELPGSEILSQLPDLELSETPAFPEFNEESPDQGRLDSNRRMT